MREFAADPPVEERIGDALRATDATIAAAESATGGLIGSLLTDVSGSSDYFDRSVVTYSYDAKRDVLAVPREYLDEEGAVSEPVARAMARGVRDTADTTWGVATTGIAGPSGGDDEDPVGTVYIGVAHAGAWGSGQSMTTVERYVFDGDRLAVKEQFARQALRDTLTAIESRRE
ncbi:CinA family protein [Haloglomus salinum]|jgi:nicotinamide-nucleotide amidase|uniref:CinA family protein n=1 Tax=Haloglomus salinum TaxID=2962673 RepID=UPI0020C983A3|nr:CinA family protein [Haloglomus salinum]